MGFDIYGINPKTQLTAPERPELQHLPEAEQEQLYNEYISKLNEYEEEPGTYFRSNVWYWRPIVAYLQEYADDILSEEDIAGMSENSGYTITGEKFITLRDRMKLSIDEKYAAQWVKDYNNKITELPDETCHCCDGRGVVDSPPIFADMSTWNGDCHVCNGSGIVPHFGRNYPADIELLEEFSDFMQNNEGFEVW